MSLWNISWNSTRRRSRRAVRLFRPRVRACGTLASVQDSAAATVSDPSEVSSRLLYGRWSPLEPAAVAALLVGSGVRWWIVGGRAARVGAPARHHADTDVAVNSADLPALRHRLANWHLWEAHEGALRPLLARDNLAPGREQLWMRRDADHPWVADWQVHHGEDEWVFGKDARVRLPWDRALHTVHGVPYLRPEVALLHKAHLNRAKDRADLAAAVLDPSARAWLVDTLTLLHVPSPGHPDILTIRANLAHWKSAAGEAG